MPGATATYPPWRTLDSRPSNMPIPATSLIGREREVAEAVTLLAGEDVRLLTLTGPAGTGKTRLALQVAAGVVEVERMEDGAFFIDLAPLVDPALVMPTVAQKLGVRETGGRQLLESLCAHLQDRQVLLLLDNFEQVLGAATGLADLLMGCPRLKLLVTSRAVLRLRAEHDYLVPPLQLPSASAEPAELLQNEAVRLFLERAQAAKMDFALTAESAAAVAQVCRRLDGLPLAIELAATRVRLLPPAALLARLEQRLPLLTGGARDLPARQRTLRGAIDWSYQLLAPEEQRLFRCLGVFGGGATLEAVEAISDDPGALERLATLEEQSMLRVSASREGESRLALLETLREYALDQLRAIGEEEAVRRAHAEYYLGRAETAAPLLTGVDQTAALAALERDHDNLRSALRWCLDGDQRETAVRLGGALWRFWLLHGHFSEGQRWCDDLLACDGGVLAGHWAKLLRGAGVLAFYQGDLRRAARVCGDSLSLYDQLGDKAGAAAAIHTLAQVARNGGDYAASAAMFERSLALAREAGDTRGVADAVGYLAMVRYFQGDLERARSGFEEAERRWGEMGDLWAVAQAHQAHAWCISAQGEMAAARVLLERAMPILTGLGDRRGVGKVLWGLGDAALREGDLATARARFVESLVELRAVGDRFTSAWTLERLAAVAVAAEEPRRATALLAAAQALRDETGAPTPPVTLAERDATMASARAALGASELGIEWDRGRAMSPIEAADYQPDERGQATPPHPDALAPANSSRPIPEKALAAVDPRGRGCSTDRARPDQPPDRRPAPRWRAHGRDARRQRTGQARACHAR